MFRFLWIVMAVGLSGCQSGAAAMKLMCMASKDAPGLEAGQPPQVRQVIIARYISEEVTNSDAILVYQALASVDPKQKGRLLKRAAAELGYHGPCPIADPTPGAKPGVEPGQRTSGGAPGQAKESFKWK